MQFGRATCVNILDEMSQDLLKANFFSIIMDEATDVSQITDGVLKSLKDRLDWKNNENDSSEDDKNDSEFENISDNPDMSMDNDSGTDEELDSLENSDVVLGVVIEEAISAARVSQGNQQQETSAVKQPLLSRNGL